jgi:hypothetical protein
MLKLKDIKERFNCNACIKLAKHYNIYSKTRDGKRSYGLYLGYVSVNNGKATHYPTGIIVSDIDELDRIANEWADNAEYEVSTYNPDCRESYVAELRIHDHLTKLGFVNNGYRDSYDLVISTITNNTKHASLWFNIQDMYSDDSKIDCTLTFDNVSHIDLSADTYKELIEKINSVIFSSMIVMMSHALTVCEKIDDFDFSKYDEMLLKQVKGFAMEEISFKDHLIKTLEDTFNKLKGN